MRNFDEIIIVGGGLAGSEAAWQAAEKGLKVVIYEMRPAKETGAHQTGYLSELVCSNSLGSNLADRASGLLKAEMRIMNSLLLRVAEKTAVPAGGALAVDRDLFAQEITEILSSHENIEIIRKEIKEIPQTPCIIASGPLTSDSLSKALGKINGQEHLYFFDAISPIVSFESINMDIAYRASRYDKGEGVEGDYINCPMNKEEYFRFIKALCEAERIKLKSFELVLEEGVKAGHHSYFEGCLPVEIIAQRGEKSMAYGPMRPVGLRNPRTNQRPYAVLQLRQDNLSGSMFNLVGFQTNLTFSEQRKVFRMIPGLENAEFFRYGQMHRNTFINSPKLLNPSLQYKERQDLFFAGQITGIEGYMGNIASGVLAGLNIVNLSEGKELMVLPKETMLGALCHYITNASDKDFQPMKANFGIVPPLTDGVKRNKRGRAEAYSKRAINSLEKYIEII